MPLDGTDLTFVLNILRSECFDSMIPNFRRARTANYSGQPLHTPSICGTLTLL